MRSKLPDKLQTPYWIVSVPKEIIRDHSDIFNENALAMMARLFRVSNPQAETGLVTTAAPRTMHLVDLGEKPAPTKRNVSRSRRRIGGPSAGAWIVLSATSRLSSR